MAISRKRRWSKPSLGQSSIVADSVSKDYQQLIFIIGDTRRKSGVADMLCVPAVSGDVSRHRYSTGLCRLQVEGNSFGTAAGWIDTQLRAALLFTRADAALAPN